MYQIVSRHHSVASLHHLGERMDGMWLIIIMAPKLAFIFIILNLYYFLKIFKNQEGY